MRSEAQSSPLGYHLRSLEQDYAEAHGWFSRAAALRALGEWLAPQLAEFGTFTIGVRGDMAEANIQ